MAENRDTRSSESAVRREESSLTEAKNPDTSESAVRREESSLTEAKRVSQINFLEQFRAENKIHSVEFMRIWKHYDKNKTGYLETKELDRFLKDLLKEKGEKADAKNIQFYKNVMLECFDINQNKKIEISELAKLLPVEQNFLDQFPVRKRMSRTDFNVIFQHYDLDKSGQIGDMELLGLLRDLFNRNNQKITATELEEYMKMAKMIYDVKEDGKLSQEEVGMLLSKTM